VLNVNKEKLEKWNLVCVVVIIASALTDAVIIADLTNLLRLNTAVSDAPISVIKALVYTPLIIMCAAILLRAYLTYRIKKQ
jgi:hypothetical protein